MIRYLIKNNFKLMLRNKWAIIMLILGPILVVGVLASAFNDLLKSYEGVDEFDVGYNIEEDSSFEEYISIIKEAGNESGINFIEHEKSNPEDVINNGEIVAFVEFGTNTYTIYESVDYEVEGITLEYFINKIINEYLNVSLQMMTPQQNKTQVTIPVETIEYMPDIDATDYYGIAYIVYFSWCGIICATGILSNEKKYGINRKYQVSTLSNVKMYLGIFIPLACIVLFGIGVSTIISTMLYEINWGNILIVALLIGINIVGSSAYGMMLYRIFNNIAMTIVVLFSTVWFMGFFGGSFETYMFSSMPEQLKLASPIYHTNRALVEVSCIGQSDYIISSIVYMLIITFICSTVAIIVDGIRKRGRA